MRKLFLPMLAIVQLTYSCGNTATKDDADGTHVETSESIEEIPSESQYDQKSILDFFPELGPVQTTAQAGEHVLAPSYRDLEKLLEKPDQVVVYTDAKMGVPGEKTSEVRFSFVGNQTIQNQFIIPIPTGQTAKKGDIILTWWQSGSGIQRAIVTNDSDPKAPEVHYLDMKWESLKRDNRFTEKIAGNTFVQLKESWQPGTTVAVAEENGVNKYSIRAIHGDRVLVSGFVDHLVVLDKSVCTPLKPLDTFKVGDNVQAPWSAGDFRNGVVKEVLPEYGRVVVVFDSDSTSEYHIPMGDVTTGLDL